MNVEAPAPLHRAAQDGTVSMLSARARSGLTFGHHPTALEAYAEAYRRSGQAGRHDRQRDGRWRLP